MSIEENCEVKQPKIKKKLPLWARIVRVVAIVIVTALCICQGYYLLQRYWAHKDGQYKPTHERVKLTEETDYETIFLQTGLGKSAVDKLIQKQGFQAILDAQEAFFNPPEVRCTALLGWFTREDQFTESQSGGHYRSLVDLQPGDILISLATHSFGWYHGHAAIVVDDYTVIESAVLGSNSQYGTTGKWCTYSNYAVLRIKNVTEEQQQELIAYCKENLMDIPYSLTSGIFGDKAPEPDSAFFGMQCSYLAWYAWYQNGYDLDSDGGRIVTPHDILHSPYVDVVQLYGMDPHRFIEN